MSEQPSFRYVSLAVGAFVLVTLLISAAVIFEAGRVHHWFREDVEVRVDLPNAGSFGLQEGGTVMLLGTDVGRVRDIQIDPNGDMHAEITIAAEFMPFVRKDSVALIKKRFGVAGDAFLEISRGEGAPLDPVNPTLVARADETPTEIIELVMHEIRNELSPAIRDIRSGIQSWIRLSDNLQEPTRNLDALLTTFNGIMGRIERGEGTLGMLLTDDTIARDLSHVTAEIGSAAEQVRPMLEQMKPVLEDAKRASTDISATARTLRSSTEGFPATVENVDDTLRELRALIGDLRTVAQALPSTAQSVDRAASDLPALMLQTQATLRETERFLTRLQQHWLFGGTPAALPAAAERIPAAEAAP